MLLRLRSQLPLWRRALRRRRRLLALLALAVAVAALLPSVLPPSVRGTEVVVAREQIPAGTELAPEHLRTVRIADQLVPEDAPTGTQDLLGRTTAVPLVPGAPVLPAVLAGPQSVAVPAGSVLMVVPVAEVLLPHLRPGIELELLLPDPVSGHIGRVPAQVIEVAEDSQETDALGSGAAGTMAVLVAVERARAGELAHALGAATVEVAVIG